MLQNIPTASISFGARVRKSPFFDSTRNDGAKAFSVYNHMYMPTAYADGNEEYNSLVNDVTMWDVAVERQIEINGPDAYKLVRMITPRNLEKCEIGHCLYIVLTDDAGGIINDAVLLRLKPDQFWISPGDGDVLLWIQGFATHSGLDVNVFEPDVSPLQIGGPKAPALINKLFGGQHDDLRFYRARETSLDGIPLVIGRTGWSGEISYELYLRDGKLGNKLWSIVKEAGQEFNIAPAAPNCIRSIEGGLLSYVSDITRDDCPFTIGLARLVDVDQDVDFIGKEALKKIKESGPSRQLVGIEIEDNPITVPPENPWPILDSKGMIVGHVSRCIYSPRLGKNIGFANVPVSISSLGTTIKIAAPDRNLNAKVSKFPWIPAERINRRAC
ncbi:MAG: glycine cleavage T C-terminal barrel domain-containing protein [Porticoccaceae bacterium]|nr:glycine cleavage T C-terminal barrel domain-containing protein [Porticoccaceae bacterium]